MSAVSSLRQGDLDASLRELQDDIRREPTDARHRVFLFQLLSVMGQWDRALTQLNVARDLDPATLLMAQTYQELLRCEVFRGDVFAGKRSPLVFGEPEPWVAKAIESHRLSIRGTAAAASSLRDEAWEEAPASEGRITTETEAGDAEETEFHWIADSDTRLGPIVEAIVDGRYFWVPFQCIQEITIDPPTDLRDAVWTPARFTWSNQGQAAGMIPTRYPGSESHEDADLRLARKTEWTEAEAGVVKGFGQRVLATDVGDFALMNIRTISLHPPTGIRCPS